jgi:hypothetical protein
MIQRKFLLAAIAGLLFAGPLAAQADVLTGPSLTAGVNSRAYTGIGFTANIDSTLTSFVFQNTGMADTISLYDPLGNVLDSIDIASGDKSFTAVVNWSLTSGDKYYLLSDTANNAYYGNWNLGTPSDTEITLNQTGVFSTCAPSTSCVFAIADTTYWAAFNNITTTSVSPVPEPPVYAMLVAGLALLGWQARRNKARKGA